VGLQRRPNLAKKRSVGILSALFSRQQTNLVQAHLGIQNLLNQLLSPTLAFCGTAPPPANSRPNQSNLSSYFHPSLVPFRRDFVNFHLACSVIKGIIQELGGSVKVIVRVFRNDCPSNGTLFTIESNRFQPLFDYLEGVHYIGGTDFETLEAPKIDKNGEVDVQDSQVAFLLPN